MSRVEYADPQAPAPRFGVPDAWEPRRPRRVPTAPHWLRRFRSPSRSWCSQFFSVSYWLPETVVRWARSCLTQLAAGLEVSRPRGPAAGRDPKTSQLGIAGALLLILSLLIFLMARSRYWMARMWIWAPVLAGAAVCVANTAVLAVREDLSRTALSVILMIVWVAPPPRRRGSACSSMSSRYRRTRHGRSVHLGRLHRARRSGHALWVALFAPEVREVAAELQNNAELQTQRSAFRRTRDLLFHRAWWGWSPGWFTRCTRCVASDERRTGGRAGGS